MWDEEDGFYYDVLKLDDGAAIPIKVRSLVGLLPLLAVAVGERGMARAFRSFASACSGSSRTRPRSDSNVAALDEGGYEGRLLLAVVGTRAPAANSGASPRRDALLSARTGSLDFQVSRRAIPTFSKSTGSRIASTTSQRNRTAERLVATRTGADPYGFRSIFCSSKLCRSSTIKWATISRSSARPGSGKMLTLWEVSMELSHRFISLFYPRARGGGRFTAPSRSFKPIRTGVTIISFFEYFHGDDGRGLGASHQTGWTGLVAKLIQQHGEYCALGVHPLAPERKKVTESQSGAPLTWGDT